MDNLTLQEAADLLNVSKEHVMKLLNADELPSTGTGGSRRIRRKDLLEYKRRRDAESEKAFSELARQAQEEDMGY